MMLDVQMLVMVFSSGLYCCLGARVATAGGGAVVTTGRGAGGGRGGGGDGDVSMTSIGACRE